MTNKELQDYLKKWPDIMPIRLLPNATMSANEAVKSVIDLTEENIMWTTEDAWVDSNVDPETWDTEDGKIVYDGSAYLLFNPIIT